MPLIQFFWGVTNLVILGIKLLKTCGKNKKDNDADWLP